MKTMMIFNERSASVERPLTLRGFTLSPREFRSQDEGTQFEA